LAHDLATKSSNADNYFVLLRNQNRPGLEL